MTGPIEAVVVDAQDVEKSGFRGYANSRIIHRFADADAVRAADCANLNALLVSPRLYEKDTADTTTADDGATCIRDAGGIAFKHLAVGIAITSVEGAHSSLTTYAKGALVSKAGSLFVSRQDANLDNDPDTATPGDTAWWMLVPTIAGAAAVGTSTTSLAIGTGSKAFETQSGLSIVAGSRTRQASAASPAANYMEGVVTEYSGTTLTVLVDRAIGSGTHEDWNISLAGDPGAAGVVVAKRWDFSDATAAEDPGAGALAFNHATPASITALHFNDADAAGIDRSAWLARLDASTNASDKGVLEITDTANPDVQLEFTVTASADSTGFWTVTVTHLSGTVLPGDGNEVAVTFTRTGNTGASGGVTSVNGATGTVVLNPDDLDDSATANKFTTAAEIYKLAAIEAAADVTDATNVAAAGAAMLAVEGQPLTGGVAVTSKDLGTMTSGTLTLDMGDRPNQHYVNNGAHTLAPGAVVGSILLDITNDASAGAITTSGFIQVTGDSFTTTDTHAFRCHVSVGEAGSVLNVLAMQ